jgi:hypothetical protein
MSSYFSGHVLKAREMSGQSRLDHCFSNHIYSKVSLHARKLGHLAAVYCVAFDRTGKYIFFEYSKVSLEAVNKPFYGFSQYMCNSVEVVKNM